MLVTIGIAGLAGLAGFLSFTVLAQNNTINNVPGKAFSRIINIWLENSDYEQTTRTSITNFAKQGILLTNYFGTTHPSQPNYLAVVAGDTFGMNDDLPHSLPENYTTLADLLENKGIRWTMYQENYPGNCFNGTYDSTYLYARKHNPMILLGGISNNATRCANIVGFNQWEIDVRENNVAQYSFVTPNLNNDGHNTSVEYAAKWLQGWLSPLVNNTIFMKDTLILITFDESENKKGPNRIYTLMLGGVVPSSEWGTTDNTFYTHYSNLKTVELNWELNSLGRQDENKTVSNVYGLFVDRLNYKNMNVTSPPPMNTMGSGFLLKGDQISGSLTYSPRKTYSLVGTIMTMIFCLI